MTSSRFLRQGTPHAILHDGFWKGDPDFIFMFNWHFLSILNGLDVIRLLVCGWDFPTGGEILGIFGKNDPQNVNWEKHTCWEGTSLRQTASFKPLAGISLLGAIFWDFWAKWPPKRQLRETHLLGGHFLTSLRQTASFKPLCVKLSLSVWPVQVRKIKRQEGRQEEKSQEVYISRRPMCGATPSGRIPTKHGTSVRLTDVIKRAKLLERFRSCEVLKFPCCHREPRPSLTLC